MYDNMDYSLIHHSPDGTGMFLVTLPGTPDRGSYMTEQEFKEWIVSSIGGGIVPKGDSLSSNLPAADESNKGWEYYCTDLNKYAISDGTAWIYFSNSPIVQTPDATDTGHALSNAVVTQQLNNIEDGTTVVEKAKCDKNGNQIDTTYAKQDGYYKNLGAGTAEQLISTVFTEDKVPYNFRTAGGSIDIGDREEDEIVGGSLVWGQEIPNSNFTNHPFPDGGVSSVSYDFVNDITHYTSTMGDGGYGYVGKVSFLIKKDHIYFYGFNISATNVDAVWAKADNEGITPPSSIYTAGFHYFIQKSTRTGNSRFLLGVAAPNGTSVSADFSKVNCFDLTQMFGSQIADYIYTLETGNAGAGVAWFRKLFPKPYYAYNAGSLESVCVSAHNMTGFNQWDEQWEKGSINNLTGADEVNNNQWRSSYIPILPNTQYYLMRDVNATENVRYHYYDANKIFVSSPPATSGNIVITTPDTACYIRVRSTGSTWATYIKGQICINLSWDGERDGEYEPYVLNSYALDHTKVLRGIPKLDGNNKLYFDGDIYKSEGSISRRAVILNMSEMNWQGSNGRFKCDLVNVIVESVGDFVSDAGYTVGNVSSTSTEDKVMAWTAANIGANQLRIIDSTYSTANALKGSLSGKTFIYLTTESTLESADPYTNPQIVNDFGTEEYVDYPESQGIRDVAIPVGHNTKYQANLKAKLEMAPNSPSCDGEYVVKQTSGENAYISLPSASAIVALNTRVPACPTSTDGTFVLKATVIDGAVTYSWVAE